MIQVLLGVAAAAEIEPMMAHLGDSGEVAGTVRAPDSTLH